jgi:uncharacterized membrane protein HdeD (DUF308 family)
MPKRDDLSGGLKALANRQAFVIGDHLTSDVERLIREIESLKVGKRNKRVARPKNKKDRKFPWLKWISLSLITTPIIFILFMYVSNLIWYYASYRYLYSIPFVFIGLQAVADSKTFFIYLLLCEGIVSIIQWLVILRVHQDQGLFWVIANSVIGLVTGFVVDIIFNNNIMSNIILLLGIMIMLWVSYNLLIGPILLNKRISTSG